MKKLWKNYIVNHVINTKVSKDTDIQSALAASYLISQDIEYIRAYNAELTSQALKFNDRLNVF